MDQVSLDSISFPVVTGTLSRNHGEPGVGSWCIEIECGESPQLDYRNWSDDREEQEQDWLAGAEAVLSAQMLPLAVDSPDELVGRTFSFPQTPDDEPADWDQGAGWPFFSLYLLEHDLIYPTTLTFTEREANRIRVKISGSYPVGQGHYDLQAEAWLKCS